MPKIAGVDIAKVLNSSFKSAGGLPSFTLTSVGEGTRSSTDPTLVSDPPETSHSANGIEDSYRESLIDGTSILRGDRKVTLLAASIAPAAIPKPGDKITNSETGTVYTIVTGGVMSDPATATYTCQCRRI